jgi:hypothetical protein
MQKMLLIVVSFLILNSTLKAQDSLKNQLGLIFGMTKQDFFTGLTYSRSISKFEPFTSLEFGITKTFFQFRVFPRFSIGLVYKVVNRNKFTFGPTLSYSYSFLKINFQSEQFHRWNELYGGYKLSFGGKIKLTNMIACGWMNERFFNQLIQKSDGVNGFGFYINVGMSYAL